MGNKKKTEAKNTQEKDDRLTLETLENQANGTSSQEAKEDVNETEETVNNEAEDVNENEENNETQAEDKDTPENVQVLEDPTTTPQQFDKNESFADDPSVREDMKTWTETAKQTKEALDKEQRVTIMIPLGINEPEGATHPVGLNGYNFLIRKNSYVEVPMTIAEMIKESFNQTRKAGQQYRVERSEAVMKKLNVN